MLSRWQTGYARDPITVGSDQRDQACLQRPLVQLHVVAEAEPAEHVEQLLERGALGVEQ